jgi:hypothetical protein
LQIESNETVPGWFPQRVTVRYNKIYATLDNTFGIYITQGQAKTVDVYSNLIYSSTKTTNGGGIWVVASVSPSWTGAKLNFYNNTIFTSGGRSFNNDCSVPGVVTLKNNLIYNTGADNYGMVCLVNNITGATTHSNNLYYRSANINYTKIKDGSVYKQTPDQVISWEAAAKVEDPLFVTPGTDFRLKPGSPAIGAGETITGITKDIDGVPYSNPPDIGCYQSVTNNLVTSVPTVKETGSSEIKITIYPNPVHHILNILCEYSSTYNLQDATNSPNSIRIVDMSGKLFLERRLEPGRTSQQIPINISSGVYVILLISHGVTLSTQKLIVYN